MKVRTVPLMLALLAAVFAFQLNASMLSPALATMEKNLTPPLPKLGLPRPHFLPRLHYFPCFCLAGVI